MRNNMPHEGPGTRLANTSTHLDAVFEKLSFTRDLGMPYTLNVHVLNNYIVQHAHEHAIFSIFKHK